MIFDKLDRDSKDIVFVYTTCSSIEEARNIGYRAIEERLAISLDYFLVNSIYPWKGVIQEIDQCMLVFSTQKSISDSLVKFVESEHSYNIPMIIKSDVLFTNKDYSFWVDNTLSSKEKYITMEEEMLRKKKEQHGYEYGKLK